MRHRLALVLLSFALLGASADAAQDTPLIKALSSGINLNYKSCANNGAKCWETRCSNKLSGADRFIVKCVTEAGPITYTVPLNGSVKIPNSENQYNIERASASERQLTVVDTNYLRIAPGKPFQTTVTSYRIDILSERDCRVSVSAGATVNQVINSCSINLSGGSENCVSAKSEPQNDGSTCMTVSNGCSKTISAYLTYDSKGKPVQSGATISSKSKETLCKGGSPYIYIGYCDLDAQQSSKCRRPK